MEGSAKIDGLFHGKSHLEMDDDWGTTIYGNTWFDDKRCDFSAKLMGKILRRIPAFKPPVG